LPPDALLAKNKAQAAVKIGAGVRKNKKKEKDEKDTGAESEAVED